MEQLWGFLGKVAVVLGIILTALKIREHFKSSKSKLIAKVEPYRARVPPQIFHFQNDLRKKWPTLSINYKLSQLTKDEYGEICSYLKNLYDDVSHGEFSAALDYDGCWDIEIKNNSASLCRHVHLDIPNCKYATIRQQNNVSCIDLDRIVRLEEIRPDETVYITAWVRLRPDFYDAKRMKLNHDAGKGVIKPVHTISGDSPVNSFSYQMKKDVPTVFLMAVIIASVLALFNKNSTVPLKNEISGTNTIQAVISTNALPEKNK